MRLTFCFRDFDQVLVAQTRGFRQNRARDGYLVIPCEASNDGRRRVRYRRKLAAHFGKSYAGTDVRDRSNLDRLDEALKHLVEKLDLLAIETASGEQKKIRNALDGIQAFFRRTDIYRGFDFVGDR